MLPNNSSNRYITSLLTTSSVALIAGFALASDTNLPKEDATSNSNQARPVLSTPDEMYNYGEDLHKVCLQKRYDEAFAKAFPEPLITTQLVAISDHERYTFNRDASLCLIYIAKARKEQLNPEKAIEWFKKAIAAADHYLENAQALFELTQRPDVINRIKIHKNSIYYSRRTAYDEWCNLIRDEEDQNGLIKKKLLEHVVSNYEKYFDLHEQIPDLKTKTDNIEDKFILFTRYLTLSKLSLGDEKTGYIKKARSIHKAFEKNPKAKNHFKKTTRYLKLQDREAEIGSSSSTSAIKSSKIQQLKLQKEKEIKTSINTEYFNLDQEDDTDSPQMRPEIDIMHKHFITLFKENPHNSALLAHLNDIEGKIQNELIKVNLPSTLADVYKQYAIFLGGETLRLDIIAYILPALIHLGDYSGALERVNILAELEYNQIKNNSVLTKFLRAAIRNLNGDYTEWEKFEQDITAEKTKVAERKKKVKEEQHEKMLEDIKKVQQKAEKAKEEQSIAPSKSLDTREKKSSSSSEQRSQRQDEPSFISADEERQARQEKLKRHEEAEKARQEEAMSSSSQTSSSTHSWDSTNVTQTTTTAFPSPISSKSIKDVYDLTGSAKHTDAEIEDDTWKISRDQLITYFEALGCTASNGGKHKKISLPEALIIKYEGETITVLNDLGGALTLPRWDGAEGNGTVPHYLRGQILKARTKLVQLKLKADQAMPSSSSNTSGSGSN